MSQNLSGATFNSSATSVFISESDVYVSGYIYNAKYRWIATIWKNGELQYLLNKDGDYSSFATSVFVSDNDVYVVGYENIESWRNIAILWKNGERQNLTDGSTQIYPSSVFVSDNDVYVVITEDVKNEDKGKLPWRNGNLWKNGEILNFSNGFYETAVSSLYVVDSNVYVAGNILERKCCK